MKTIVETEQVSRTFLLGKTKVKALTNVSIQAFEGEFLAIAGPSGSGKTTLLNLIGCIDQPTSGIIKIDNEIVKACHPTNSPISGLQNCPLFFRHLI